MSALTRREAAEYVAAAAIAFALRTGQRVTGEAIEAAASQMWHSGPGTIGREACETYNYRVAHRIAIRSLEKGFDRPDLVGLLREESK